jgi:hypothetical protein
MDYPKEEQDNNLSTGLLEDVEQQDDLMAGPVEIVVDPLQAGHGIRGEAQAPEYRDGPFAIGFIAHLVVVIILAFSWGTGSLKPESESDNSQPSGDDSVSLHGLLWLCFLTSLASIAISAASLELMTRHTEQLIQLSLITSCSILMVVAVAMFAIGAAGVAFIWLFLLVLTGLYAYSVWNRIPFAAANLRTGLSAIQTNYGVCMLAYGVAFCANFWVLTWILAFIGVTYKESTCSDGVCKSNMDPVSFVLLVISYHWTSQVLKVRSLENVTVHVLCCAAIECSPCHNCWRGRNMVVCSSGCQFRLFSRHPRLISTCYHLQLW